MPGGLSGVEQTFTADASGYISEIQAMIKANQGLVQSVAEAKRAVGDAGKAPGGSGADDIAKVNQAIRDQLRILGDYSRAVRDVSAATGEMGRAHTQVAGTVGGHADAVDTLGASYEAARQRIAAMTADALAANERIAASFGEQVRAVDQVSARFDTARESVRGFATEVSGLRTEVEKTATSAATQGESLVQFWRRISPGGGDGGGGGGGTGAPFAQWNPFAPGGGGGLWPAAVQPGGGGGGGGGGGFLGGLAGSIAGGGAFDFGGALRQYDATATFLKRFYSFAHYAVMGANEILATVGPAAVAGIAGAYVGLEGGQTAVDRIKAVNAVGQSLGSGTPGSTPGQLLGLGDSLQKAQTAADPQVWELLGAALNSVKAASDSASGGLGNFWQLGTNTIHMVDQFAASVTQAFQGGAGNQLQALVSGGTGDLKQFGDVLGNVGTTFLHMAPALPGVGGDYLSVLQGATRALSVTTGAIPTTALGMLLAGEAGGRLGGPIVGGVARLAGKIPGLGSVARAATADDIAAGTIGLESGLPVATVGETIGGEGVAGALGAASLPTIAALAAGAYTISKIATAQTPGQQRISGLQSQINQSNFTQGLNSLMQNMFETAGQTGGPQSVSGVREFGRGLATEFAHGNLMLGVKEQLSSIFGGSTSTTAGTNTAAVQQWASQIKGVQATAQDIAKTFGVDLPTAFSLADQAGLQVGDSLDKKTGELNAKSKTMIQNTLTGYQAMNASSGVLYKNVGAVQIAQGLAGSQLATVNSAWDQLVQNAAGGTSGATGFAGGMQALADLALPQAQKLPSSQVVKGIERALGVTSSQAQSIAEAGGSAKNVSAIANALTGFTSPASQAAWSAFSNTSSTSPGQIQQANSMMDWLRTAQTSGVLSQGQVSAAGMYQARQLLPYAKKSPAALAQLGILSQEAGGPGFDPSKNQAQNYAAISGAIDKAAASGANFNKIMTAGTIGMSDVTKQAQTFGASMKSNVYDAMEKGAISGASVTKDMQQFLSGVSSGNLGGVKNLAKDFAAAKASAGDISTIMGNVLSGKGLGAGQIKTITTSMQSAVAAINAQVKVTADTASAKAAIASLGHVAAQPKVTVQAVTSAAQAAINAIRGKDVPVPVRAEGIAAVQAAIASIHGKTVTITINTVNNLITHLIGAAGTPGGVAGSTLIGGGANQRITQPFQTGGMVPGSGSGDIIPAMLEPGEAIIPRYLVPLIAPILASHRVPGFGGVPQASSSHFAAGGIAGAGSTPWLPYWEYEAKKRGWVPPTIHSGTGGGASTVDGTAKQFAFTLTGKIAEEVKNAAGAKKIADALITKIGQEVALAKNVSSAAMQGQGFGNSGIFGSMDVTPGTGNGTVMEQMQSYLTSVQSFTKDLGTLRKDHLNKNIISQLVGAGPVQGDALAQSILNDYGGVKGVNQVWAQLGHATKGLGAQAAMAQYGGTLAPNLKSASVVNNNVSVSVSVPGGGQGDLQLSAAQIKSLVEKVQAALLKQARRNNKTGLQAAGKGA